MAGAAETFLAEPVTAAEADALLAPLLRFDALLLAVSGGADSMALLELAAAWRHRIGPVDLKLFVATVDHGLRPESKKEAEFVARRCAALDLDHTILTWSGAKPSSGLASAARDARYALLASHALERARSGDAAIVTAHSEDDQAETFLMRLARGSGVDGLAAMADFRPIDGSGRVTLARPLLGTSKARLVATLAAAGLSWREDPSNQDEVYERVRVRAAMNNLAAAGIAAPALATSARRIRDARAALVYADRAFQSALGVDYHDEILASFDRGVFSDAPPLLQARLLARLIDRFGGATPAPRLSEIEALSARLAARREFRATLGGAVVSASARSMKIWREPGRLDRADVVLAPATPILWDNRFVVHREGREDLAVRVRPLGADGLAQLAPVWAHGRRPPSAALASLPSFWLAKELVAAPSIRNIATFSVPAACSDLTFSVTPLGELTAASR